jgi:hypothetical protein
MSETIAATLSASRRVDDRVIEGANPDFLTALGYQLVFAVFAFATIELGPERLVVSTVCGVRRDEQGVVLALDFSRLVAE